MSTPNEQRNSAAVWLTIAALLLPPAYVLSYGPMLLLVKWGVIEAPYTAFNSFYWPLDMVCWLVPGFSEWLRWYAAWGAKMKANPTFVSDSQLFSRNANKRPYTWARQWLSDA